MAQCRPRQIDAAASGYDGRENRMIRQAASHFGQVSGRPQPYICLTRFTPARGDGNDRFGNRTIDATRQFARARLPPARGAPVDPRTISSGGSVMRNGALPGVVIMPSSRRAA